MTNTHAACAPSLLVSLTQSLLKEPSITPDPKNCMTIIEQLCKAHHFYCRRMDFDDTANLFISTHQSKNFSLLFCGHVDVVSPGALEHWHTDPFSATVIDHKLYGRGAVDMKSSIAAFLFALFALKDKKPNHLPIAAIITSDEEGPATNGTKRVIHQLNQEGYCFDNALVGEPTSVSAVGDTIKVGRRGSLSAKITLTGTQSHIAYAQHADNPIFALSKFITLAQKTTWDSGHSYFPATQVNITTIHSDSGAGNITPMHASCSINFRFNPSATVAQLKQKVVHLLSTTSCTYHIDWHLNSHAFFKPPGQFCEAIQAIIVEATQIKPDVTTTGGTSDARFIAPFVHEVVELGPLHQTAHQVNEHIPLADLGRLFSLYTKILKRTTAND